MFNRWKEKAKGLTENLYVLYGAYKNKETPWYAKFLAIMVVAYALSPIDLIPDFIPVIGYIDDLILIPIGVYFALKLIPEKIVEESRQKVKEKRIVTRGIWVGTAFIASIWFMVLYQVLQEVVQ